MRTIRALIIIGAMCLSTVGCDDGAGPDGTGDPQPQPAATELAAGEAAPAEEAAAEDNVLSQIMSQAVRLINERPQEVSAADNVQQSSSEEQHRGRLR